jgi:hypothetical protein
MCPYYLDGDHSEKFLQVNLIMVHLIPVLHWLLCSFQGPRRGNDSSHDSPGQMVLELPAQSRSLKTQQHAACLWTERWALQERHFQIRSTY